jgi:dGTPase
VKSDYNQALLAREELLLADWATRSAATRGRAITEDDCLLRLPFQRDRDRIIHCKSFRRLTHKTQVFIAPEGDHYRTRLTHTLEVAQIARTAARLLHLNEDLTEAIALGHDLGHTPFGHAGEQALDALLPNGFSHNQQSLRVVECLEGTGRDYPGLNLTWEVRDGILNHCGDEWPATPEGQIVRWADRIAYINHDLDDAIRAQLVTMEDLPGTALAVLGKSTLNWLTILLGDLVETSAPAQKIGMSPPVEKAFLEMHQFMFDNVYIGSEAKLEELKVQPMIHILLEYFAAHEAEIPEQIRSHAAGDRQLAAVDFIAGMTDRYAVEAFRKRFIPKGWVD